MSLFSFLEKEKHIKGENSIYQIGKTDRFGLDFRKTIHFDQAYKVIKNGVD